MLLWVLACLLAWPYATVYAAHSYRQLSQVCPGMPVLAGRSRYALECPRMSVLSHFVLVCPGLPVLPWSGGFCPDLSWSVLVCPDSYGFAWYASCARMRPCPGNTHTQ
jgi:hypothetical protein